MDIPTVLLQSCDVSTRVLDYDKCNIQRTVDLIIDSHYSNYSQNPYSGKSRKRNKKFMIWL